VGPGSFASTAGEVEVGCVPRSISCTVIAAVVGYRHGKRWRSTPNCTARLAVYTQAATCR
jgi:hypothetical protein